ncbi:unnamed protein product [Cochlearia groenlandica]
MDTRVNQEIQANPTFPPLKPAVNSTKPSYIDLCSSDEENASDSRANPEEIADVSSFERTVDSADVSRSFSVGEKRSRSDSNVSPAKRLAIVVKDEVEEGFGQSIPSYQASVVALPAMPCAFVRPSSSSPSCKQFWKAGDYEGTCTGDWEVSAGGFDHVRVHPKFLHSNATSHKWALGAFAELLDNALDEVHSGATYVNIDVLDNTKDGTKMVLIEDNGGGMNPEKMRHCMSLGYSAKSKLANTIGQYGNGFKTSTMRLGADVIVFTRCRGEDGNSSTQTIGLLSYTFLKSTGKEDIVVPMLDYERRGSEWSQIMRSSVSDWEKNVETVGQWSPFSTEEDLLRQFYLMKDQGTRIIIYNLWEDDQGMLELDFDTDQNDIQLRGVNRDEKNIEMASQYPNSRHFLTYKHSLRSYVSILYLRVPADFRIILRGRDVEHHNVVNDMMQTNQVSYRPKDGAEGLSNFENMSAVVTIGFVKDAKHHIDVQGFNVYHKNRLIKPFWRLWNPAGSDGRGVIGVLEANFVEPAHDKQGFERTTVLSRLEARLIQMQKDYWSDSSPAFKLGCFMELILAYVYVLFFLRRSKCHKIGYARRQGKKPVKDSEGRESSPDYDPKGSVSTRKRTAAASGSKTPTATSAKFDSRLNVNRGGKGSVSYSKGAGSVSSEKGGIYGNTSSKSNKAKPVRPRVVDIINSDGDSESDNDISPERNFTEPEKSPEPSEPLIKPPSKPCSGPRTFSELEQENEELKERLNKKEDVFMLLQDELRREKELRKKLEAVVQETKDELEEVKKEQESLIDIFSEDRDRRDKEEERLRNKLQEASNTIKELSNGKARGR